MKKVTLEKKMTLKEVAEATGAAYSTIAEYAHRLGWTKNGKKTLLDERQVTAILEAMKTTSGQGQSTTFQDNLEGIETSRMTIRKVAEILGVNPETIKVHVRELFPELMKTGITTYLTEAQITVILEKMKQGKAYAHHVSGGDVAAYNSVIAGVETSLSKEFRLAMLYKQEAEIMKESAMLEHELRVSAQRELQITRHLLTEREAGLSAIQRIAESGGLMLSDRDDVLATYRRRK